MDNEEWKGNVGINKDILKFTEKVCFGLTLKQAICGVLTIVVTLTTYYFCSKINSQIALIISSVVAMPIAAVGFVSYNGMNFFEFVKSILFNYLVPNRIYYKSKSFYKEIIMVSKKGKRK